MRKKFRNKCKPQYEKICSDLKLLNIMIFNSIQSDISKHMENRVKNICVNINVFKEIKRITNYKKRENMSNILYESEEKEIQFVTEQQNTDALASHFEKIHQLTHRTVSVMESIVNETYDSYSIQWKTNI